jgi:GNAT superfamily N-acetyltransferase
LRCVPSRAHQCDPTRGLIEVGYFEPGQEGETTEPFVAVASVRRWIGTEGLLDIQARTAGLVGTLGLYADTKRDGRMIPFGILVAADRRRTGVGSALMRFAGTHARNAGFGAIALDVFPHNESARISRVQTARSGTRSAVN